MVLDTFISDFRRRAHIFSVLLAAQCYCSATIKDGPSLGQAISPLCRMAMAGKAGSFLPRGDGGLGKC